MGFGLHTKEVWKRGILEFIILVLLAVIYMGWKDYHYMDYQFKLFRAGLVEDVIGYNYCDGYLEDSE
jgi:hypothetical protein